MTTTAPRTLARVSFADGAVYEMDVTALVEQYARLETLRVLAEMHMTPDEQLGLAAWSIADYVHEISRPHPLNAWQNARQRGFIDWLASQHDFCALEPRLHTSRRPGEAGINYAAAWPTADIALVEEGENS